MPRHVRTVLAYALALTAAAALPAPAQVTAIRVITRAPCFDGGPVNGRRTR